MRDHVQMNASLRRPLAALLGLGLLLFAGGCAEPSKDLTQIRDWADFQTRVLQSDRPVLIEFNKDPCPTCVVQVGELEQLYPEYSDRVFFASMTIMRGFFQVTAPEVRDRYHLAWVPTTVLFIKGQEKQRWELNHSAVEIRETLKKEIGPPRQPAATANPAAAPAPVLPK